MPARAHAPFFALVQKKTEKKVKVGHCAPKALNGRNAMLREKEDKHGGELRIREVRHANFF